MESTIFKTEIVNGKCPNCNFDVVLISLASDKKNRNKHEKRMGKYRGKGRKGK
jgi:hypothetical protein